METVRPPRGTQTVDAAFLKDISTWRELLARDIAAMPSYMPSRIRLFDMFPQTDHYEAMVLLVRRP